MRRVERPGLPVLIVPVAATLANHSTLYVSPELKPVSQRGINHVVELQTLPDAPLGGRPRPSPMLGSIDGATGGGEAAVQKIEVFVIGGMMAMALGVTAIASTGPGGFTMTAEEARIAAHPGPRLIVVETSSCGWCRKLRKEIGPEYLQSTYHSEVAPLIYADMNGSFVRKLTLDAPVNSTPTLLMVDRAGHELGRLTGYPGSMNRLLRFVGRHAG